MTYETKTKPALRKLGNAVSNGTPAEIKAAADAAAEAGASLNDIFSEVGGVEEWNRVVRRLKKAGVV